MITNTNAAGPAGQAGKQQADMLVMENVRLHAEYCLLKLKPDGRLPEMTPGQFVQVRVEGAPDTFLRRPISIHRVDRQAGELWLLVRKAGDGTRRLSEYAAGDRLNVLLPLGSGFSIPPSPDGQRLLLVGGGVGVAPLLFLGETLKSSGFKPVFLLGARSEKDLLQTDAFRAAGATYLATEDGSAGEKGLVTDHSLLGRERFDRIYACGPKPMMKAVAQYAAATGATCEVSLENTMACGIGACLCCVEKTVDGHVCVCVEGPVFDASRLMW